MNRADRLLSVLAVLQTNKVVTVDFLRIKFKTSARIIHQDIQLLTALRIIVKYEDDKGRFILKGYCSSLPDNMTGGPVSGKVSSPMIVIPSALKNELITLLSTEHDNKNKYK